ncbi:hypothetical protein AKUH3B204M_11020 [Apilactobacillus kunkeei]|nr:hypothetical protein AKUH3B204M_11020 [Apilactobacillus kunkeei]CAI2636719.1 hypothetical protein AKUA1802_11690 [Apilactobacillus kunkeei]CAI2637200.1 hypothetical protein AKUA0901_11680 [Apilactobacillus kunkeei]CAI2640521.1 hypothetical protein AKUA1201_11670 [Apilactobacillus kunkeei]CAI2642650.1 hypothetical protein AKUH4B206J_11810 [Apilactobacillus kunkeei]
MKKLLLSVLLATVMFGGAAVEVTGSANAKTEHTTKHHAKKKAVKKHEVKKYAKKATKKHAKKVVKKHVAQKTTKKKARKVAKKHVAKKVVKKSVKKVAPKKVTNKAAKKDTRKLSNGVTSTGTDKYGYSGENIDTPKWSVYHGDGSQKSLDAYRRNMAKHDPEIRKAIEKYGIHDFTNDEVTF